jgi:hypothetical protein
MMARSPAYPFRDSLAHPVVVQAPTILILLLVPLVALGQPRSASPIGSPTLARTTRLTCLLGFPSPLADLCRHRSQRHHQGSLVPRQVYAHREGPTSLPPHHRREPELVFGPRNRADHLPLRHIRTTPRSSRRVSRPCKLSSTKSSDL